MSGGFKLKYLARNNDLNSVRWKVGGERQDMKCNKQLTTHRALRPNKTAMIKIKQKRVSIAPASPGGDCVTSALSSVIRTNTDNMKEIVSQLERNIRERNDEIEELKQFNEILRIRNDSLSSNHLGRRPVKLENNTIYKISLHFKFLKK